jgi:hypothetical protein
MSANAVPSALHVTKVLPIQPLVFGSQAAVVHLPLSVLHSAAVSQSFCFTKLLPSGAQSSSALSVHRYSSFARQIGHVYDTSPAWQ